MVMLNPPGVAEVIESRRHVINYMRHNFDSWLEFANASYSWGLGLRPEDLLFIVGTMKTTQWALAAFQGDMFRHKDGYVSGQFGPVGNVGFSIQISNQPLPNTHFRLCPPPPAPQVGDERRTSYRNHDTSAGLPLAEPNQCLFIHYYKMMRRLWWKGPMQAAAGPHQLPPEADNPGPDAMSPGGADPYEFEPEAHGRDAVRAIILFERGGH